MEMKVIHSIKHIDKNVWNTVTRGPFLSYEWFEFVEEALSDYVKPYYILCCKDNNVCGVMPVFCPRQNENMYTSLVFGRCKNFFKKLNSGRKEPLLCYVPNANGVNIFSQAEYTSDIRERLVTALEDVASAEGISTVAVLFITEDQLDVANHLSSRGYQKVYLNSVGILKNNFISFDEYIQYLPKRKRSIVRRDIQRFRQSGNTIEAVTDPVADIKRIYELFNNIAEKHKHERPHMNEEILATSFKKMRPYSTTYCVREGGRIIASQSIVEKDGFIDSYCLGLDYARTKESRTYFYLFYYNVIQEMIKRNAPYINFRHMAYRIKERRGCALVKQYMFVKLLKRNFVHRQWLSLVDYQYRRKFIKAYKRFK